jgi:tetratricopeptide (TPR) repeat protein
MSEQTGTTQPIQPIKEDDTQPIKPIKKPSRWKSTLISVLGFLLLIGLGGFGGYSSGIGVRQNAEDSIISQQLSEQFSYALVDIEFGRFEVAKQRLEFIIDSDPSFPGAQQKLTEVLVLSAIPTATLAPTLTATPDFSGAENAFQRAQQLISAQDWPGAVTALDTIRKLDSTYKTAQVDGMYYFALRNQGYDLITKQGNLEGGIYYLNLAERFGPLDNNSVGLRDGARAYITGASFWELDWAQAVTYFEQVGAGWPSMWDGTMTASQRYFIALTSYANELFIKQEYCAAYDVYQTAASIGALDAGSANNAAQAYAQCYPPTEVILPTATIETAPTATEPAATATP